MNIPFSCPTCGGHKTVQKPPWDAGDQQRWVSAGTELYSCPSCNGQGILWNDDPNIKVDAQHPMSFYSYETK